MKPDDASDERGLYASMWRWHFYAGLFVAPFLIVLALTGLAMLFRGTLDRWQFGSFLSTAPLAGPVTHQAQLDAARAALPGAVILRYEPFPAPEATRVAATVDGRPHTIYVDSGTGRLCGLVDDEDRLGLLAEQVHGTLLLREGGDRLIEVAAGLGVALLLSGLYLWFPGRRSGQSGGRWRWRGRLGWRNAHGWIGAILAPALLFYLVSGLAWTGIWGGRYVQAWNTYPAEKFAPAPAAEHGPPTHDVLNGLGAKAIPWNLEQTALPRSSREGDRLLTIDDAIGVARQAGIGSRFWVGLPDGPDGVWTVAQTAFDGNIHDPREELTVHVDRYTGAVRGRVAFADYSWGAKAMAAGVPLHKGHLGRWSVVLATTVCLAVILLATSGLVAWWMRRPARGWRLAAPPKPAAARIPLAVWGTVTVLAVAFPLLALTFAGIAVFDRVVVRRLPRLARLLD